MAHRRRRRFGSPLEMHRASAQRAGREARHHLKNAKAHAKDGYCADAIRSLTVGAYWLGQFRAERLGAGGRIGQLSKIAISARDRVIRACKVR